MMKLHSFLVAGQSFGSIPRIASRGACGDVTSATLPLNAKHVDPRSFCITQVRKYDRENYLAAIAIQDLVLRRIVFALRAFNVDLSLVRDVTTNSDRAKLRFHFWSRLVEEIIRRNDERDPNLDKESAYYNHTPIAKELLDLFWLVDVTPAMKARLRDLIGSRLSPKVLGYKPFDTKNELELYCEKSNSSIYHLAWPIALEISGTARIPSEVNEAVDVISHSLGVAQGLSNIIRGIPYNASKNCCYLPKDLMDKHRLTTRDVFVKNLNGFVVVPVVKKLANRCEELLDTTYKWTPILPKYFKHLFLPRVAIDSYLRQLKKCDYNVTDPRLALRNELLPLNIWLSSKSFRAPILGS